MKRSTRGTLLVVLAALLVLGAMGTATASAAWPEFTDGQPFSAMKFKGENTENVFLQEKGGSAFTCHKNTITGEITGPKEVSNVIIKYKECTFEVLTFCEQAFGSGNWETKKLKGKLAYLKKTEHRIGLLLEAEEEPIANCEFGSGKPKIKGSFIGELTRVGKNEGFNPFELIHTQKEGVQGWQKFEGEELTHSLERVVSGVGIKVGIEGKPKFTPEHNGKALAGIRLEG